MQHGRQQGVGLEGRCLEDRRLEAGCLEAGRLEDGRDERDVMGFEIFDRIFKTPVIVRILLTEERVEKLAVAKLDAAYETTEVVGRQSGAITIVGVDDYSRIHTAARDEDRA